MTVAVTTLNRLPVLVAGPGLYLARDGRTIRIHAVTNDRDDLSVTTFAAKGTLYTPTEKGVRSTFMTWHVSGRTSAQAERYSDIVAKAT